MDTSYEVGVSLALADGMEVAIAEAARELAMVERLNGLVAVPVERLREAAAMALRVTSAPVPALQQQHETHVPEAHARPAGANAVPSKRVVGPETWMLSTGPVAAGVAMDGRERGVADGLAGTPVEEVLAQPATLQPAFEPPVAPMGVMPAGGLLMPTGVEDYFAITPAHTTGADTIHATVTAVAPVLRKTERALSFPEPMARVALSPNHGTAPSTKPNFDVRSFVPATHSVANTEETQLQVFDRREPRRAVGGEPSPGAGSSAGACQPGVGQGPIEGDVYLDGALMGRWVTRYLRTQATRAPAGPTGFDARRTAMLPGVTVA